jgi:5-methylcytosine-specific restriction endonuclease McrA
LNTHYLTEDAPPGSLHPVVMTWRPKSQLRRLIKKYGMKCCWCGRICNPSLAPNADAFPTREHLVRKADGGSSRMENQRIACRKCNNSRHHPNWKRHNDPMPNEKLTNPAAAEKEI